MLSPSAGIRKRTEIGANSTVHVADDCSALADIVVGGKNFGSGFELVCGHWPEKLGQFPISDITRARALASKAAGRGGALEQIKEIRSTRAKRGFCWRNETLRTKVASNCEMKSRGVCYGKCPTGYKPGLLKGIFGPTCTTACGASERPVSCGFGCASSLGQCARTVLDQVGAVASGVGSVHSFITGEDRLAKAVDAIVGFAEFVLSVLPSVIEAVRKGIDTVQGSERGVMVAVLLFQYLQEIAPELGETGNSIKVAFSGVADAIADLVEAKRTEGSISVGRIVRNIIDEGEGALEYAVTLTKAFTYDKCKIASDVVFVVDEVGDEEFEGPYVQRGTSNNHPVYSLKSNSKLKVEWDSSKNYWQFVRQRFLLRNTYHYSSSVRSNDYPLAGWTPISGSQPVPMIVATKERSD